MAFIAAAILTPPDIISQVGLGLPILILYEISIVLARFAEKRRAQREREEDEALNEILGDNNEGGQNNSDTTNTSDFDETDFNEPR